MLEFRSRILSIVAVVLSLAAFVAVGMAPAVSISLSVDTGQPSGLAVTVDSNRIADKPIRKLRRSGFAWAAIRSDSSLKVRGMVLSEEDRRTVLGMVKAHLPDLEVEDRLEITTDAPPKEYWLGAVSFALQQLSHLKRGSVRLSNVALRIEGEAGSASDYDEVKKALTSSLPTGLKLAADKVRPPLTDPFIFSATLSPTSLTLSGSVPSEMTRTRLKELSRQLFARPTLDDQLQLASGAPTDWDEAVDAALRALGRLDSGKIALSGIALTIEGIAPDEGTAVAVSYQLKRDLPPVFSTSEAITWKQADAASGEGDDIVSRIKAITLTGSLPKAEVGERP
jgi:hypothetical protein